MARSKGAQERLHAKALAAEAVRRPRERRQVEVNEHEMREKAQHRADRKQRRPSPAGVVQIPAEKQVAQQGEEHNGRVSPRLRGVEDQHVGKRRQQHQDQRIGLAAANPDQSRDDHRPRAGRDRERAESRPVPVVSEEIQEERIEVVIVVVMDSGQNGERRRNAVRDVQRPDLVQPEIVHGRADANHRARHRCQGAQADEEVSPPLGGAFLQTASRCAVHRRWITGHESEHPLS